MERIAKIGVDVSVNSTGVSVIIPKSEENEEKTLYFQICPGKVKHSASVRLLTYDKCYIKDASYTHEDLTKILAADNLALIVYKLMHDVARQYKVTAFDARQEGSIMAGSFKKKQSRLNDLTVFNAAMKRMLLKCKLVKCIAVVAPSSLKKYATGKGNANKDAVELAFYDKNPDFHRPLNAKGENATKNDDIADAWHLANADIDESQKLYK